MALPKKYQQQLIDNIKDLPEDKLAEVVDFVRFLKERYDDKSNIVKLGGIWEGFDPSDEEIQKTRKEVWKHLDTKEIL